MIAIIDPTSIGAAAPLYHINVVLVGSKPPIWRRLQVPGNARLGWLHAVLQVVMGWTNSHLHQFSVNETFYSDTNRPFAESEGDAKIHDEWKVTLLQVAQHPQDAFGYEYDFGDSWHHELSVERILPPDPGRLAQAICLDGARACPPEDCGGIWGYAELLKILRNRKNPEHKAMKEWLGRPFDPEAFDITKANTWLRKLKWPRVTEGQLRKVLMGRDGYRE